MPSAGRHRPSGAPVGCFAGVISALVSRRPRRAVVASCRANSSLRVPSGTRAARLKREILRFNDELKRKNFPRRADKDCFLKDESPAAEERMNVVNVARAARGGGDSRDLRSRFVANRCFSSVRPGWSAQRKPGAGRRLSGDFQGGCTPPWIIFLPTFWIMPKSRGHRGLSGEEVRESFNPQSSTAPQAKRKRFSRTESPPGSRVKSAACPPPYSWRQRNGRPSAR